VLPPFETVTRKGARRRDEVPGVTAVLLRASLQALVEPYVERAGEAVAQEIEAEHGDGHEL
jgi:hypothetical protein